MEYEIESLEDALKRIGSCGGTPQLKAVKESVRLINKASGCLDHQLAATAIYHLSVALGGHHDAAHSIITQAYHMLHSE